MDTVLHKLLVKARGIDAFLRVFFVFSDWRLNTNEITKEVRRSSFFGIGPVNGGP